ncbi:MAG: hypothetical protein JWN21_719 [Sphingomonas bacterium]|uniref:hypothetical protein n=1 Tax=Sphingomonas bacterium TaxID=1895847 RepID=UPI00261EDC9F|nr:hypothetical protein [Sphingomonas bacterium]MDB5695176.1 hypothetical protein [Sphingomonas bacterium]
MLTFLLATTMAVSGTQADFQDRPRGGGMMMRADSNGDGVITRDEHLAQATERFDRMDADRDGKLTGQEMAQVGRRARTMQDGGVPRQPEPHTTTESPR